MWEGFSVMWRDVNDFSKENEGGTSLLIKTIKYQWNYLFATKGITQTLNALDAEFSLNYKTKLTTDENRLIYKWNYKVYKMIQI